MDLSKILSSPDISSLREAVAEAFEALSLETSNSHKIEAIENRVKTLEEKP